MGGEDHFSLNRIAATGLETRREEKSQSRPNGINYGQRILAYGRLDVNRRRIINRRDRRCVCPQNVLDI